MYRIKLGMEKNYKEIKKEFGLTDTDIALMFGYSSANSFRNATRKRHIINGICTLFELFGSSENN